MIYQKLSWSKWTTARDKTGIARADITGKTTFSYEAGTDRNSLVWQEQVSERMKGVGITLLRFFYPTQFRFGA